MQSQLNCNIKPAQTFTVVFFQFTASLFQMIHATGITSDRDTKFSKALYTQLGYWPIKHLLTPKFE